MYSDLCISYFKYFAQSPSERVGKNTEWTGYVLALLLCVNYMGNRLFIHSFIHYFTVHHIQLSRQTLQECKCDISLLKMLFKKIRLQRCFKLIVVSHGIVTLVNYAKLTDLQ